MLFAVRKSTLVSNAKKAGKPRKTAAPKKTKATSTAPKIASPKRAKIFKHTTKLVPKLKAAAKASMPKVPERVRTPSPALIKYLHDFVGDNIGENGLKVLTSVGEGTTDERIVESTSMKMAEIRSILNHLHSYGFVEYTREKNMQNGWFTYTWKLNADRAIQNLLMIKRKEYNELKRAMDAQEDGVYYKCKKGCTTHHFDSAMDHQFKCPTCASDLKHLNTQESAKLLESKIGAIEKLISNVNTEMV